MLSSISFLKINLKIYFLNETIDIFIYLFLSYTIAFNLYCNKSEDASVNHSIYHIQLRSIKQELRMIQIV